MREILTEIGIDASPSAVWEVLTDLSAYDEWNPQTASASGDLREGTTIEIRVGPSGSRAVTMQPTVTTVEPPRALEWVASVLTSWLFSARHTFRLEPFGDDRTRLINRERLSGLLVPVVIADDAPMDYEAMNRALKTRVEGSVAARSESST